MTAIAEERHGRPLLLGREGLTQDGLLGGLQRARAEPLQRAEDDQLRAGCVAIPHSAEPTDEEHQAGHVDALLAEEAAQERGQRHDDDGGDGEAGGDPGDLLDGGTHRAADLRQRHVDDRGVDRAHERAEGHRHGHQPLVGGRTRAGRPGRPRPWRSSSLRTPQEEVDERLGQRAPTSSHPRASCRLATRIIPTSARRVTSRPSGRQLAGRDATVHERIRARTSSAVQQRRCRGRRGPDPRPPAPARSGIARATLPCSARAARRRVAGRGRAGPRRRRAPRPAGRRGFAPRAGERLEASASRSSKWL